jgi:hypothetical protein
MPITYKKTNKKIGKVGKKTTTPKRKYIKRTKKSKKSKSLTPNKPFVLYSKDPQTGRETIAKAAVLDNKGVKGYVATVESRLPPTVYKTSNGSNFMTMNEKRSIVIESFKNTRK